MKGLCPGSFDPVTHGHLDVIARAARLFDELVVGVGSNTSKSGLFPPEERLEMMRTATADLANVHVVLFSGLVVDFCAEHGIGAVVKGLRFASDFDYELQMAQMNAKMTGLETILLPTSARWSYVSSTLVREIALLGGDIADFVPPVAAERTAALVAARRHRAQ